MSQLLQMLRTPSKKNESQADLKTGQPATLDDVMHEIRLFRQDMKKISNDVSEVKSDVSNLSARFEQELTAIHIKTENCAEEATEAKEMVMNLQKDMAEMRKQIEGVQTKTVQLESYSRRQNLIFDGLEAHGSALDRVKDVLRDKLGINPNEIQIAECHRVRSARKPEAIYCRLMSVTDKSKIFAKVSKLKGSKVTIREDFPSEVVERRRTLYPIFKNARKQGVSTKLIGDQLVVNDVKYTVNNLDLLPSTFRPQVERETEQVLAFFGWRSSFSNFHPVTFEIAGHQYSNVETYYQYSKAIFCDRQDIAWKILGASHPRICKNLGDSLKCDDQTTLQQKSLEWMLSGLIAKFSQNEVLKEKLLNTGEITLAESSTDKFWSTGLRLDDNNAMRPSEWKGSNNMGKLLMRVRETLKPRPEGPQTVSSN